MSGAGITTTLEALGKWGSGGTPKSTENSYYGGNIPWIRSGDLPDGPILENPISITPSGLENSAARWVPEGALLIALYGATIGKLGITTYPVTTNQAVAYCIPEENLTSTEFLFWYLLSARPDLISLGQGGAQPNISQAILKSRSLVLPPLQEQRRIVARLDRLFERSTSAREELGRIPRLVDRYRQEALRAAFSGNLTLRWRANLDLSAAAQTTLESVCESITDGDHQAPPQAQKGTPFITISAMNTGRIDLEKATRFVPPEYVVGLKESRRPKPGDVLFSVTGSVGIPALVEEEHDFVFQRHIAILKPDRTKIDGRFLSLMLAAPQIREQVLSVATGTAQLTVPLSGLRKFQMLLPSLEEQGEIVRLLQAKIETMESILREVSHALSMLERLEKATLTRAFRGALGSPDSRDDKKPARPTLMKVDKSLRKPGFGEP